MGTQSTWECQSDTGPLHSPGVQWAVLSRESGASAWTEYTMEEDRRVEDTEARTLDLSLLWEVIDKHRQAKTAENDQASTKWELVLIQAVLLTLLIMVAVIWAVCCKKNCCRRNQDPLSVAEALRKISKDLPPSYSKADLRSLGISVNDYLNPPPAYLDLFTDSLQYLDLEQGHNRLAKLSFCNEDGTVARLARLSVASCENCSAESPVVVPVRPDRSSSSSVSSSASSAASRRSSRNSRVSFSEEVECSNGSIRRLSTNSLIGLKDANSSKQSVSSADENRKSSLKSNLKRKLGSTAEDGFISNLDDDLKQKLEGPAGGSAESEGRTKAETQAERAARICDIIVEEK